ncbi:MAG: hypothetical protein US49_C0005G0045 [candidate division TM6 bacterium GW2011_GWF2_37_49]|nr:MAG: hypothetical protein US49_C0005G0045 [candidate division TM6 bacterium GW2011_GWF2_37_49]
MINGGPGGSHHVFHPYFSEAAKFAQVIYYDQRGTGQSSADDSGKTYTIKQAVEDLDQLRARLGLDKWFVLGWSYGGFLAQCYALTYPEHVLGLMLIASDDGLTNVEMKPGRDQMFISDGERTTINKIYADEEDGKIGLMQTNFNKDICGDWKRQHFYKPTPEEFARTALYEWNPAPGFHNLMNQEYFKISLDGKFDDF